MNAVNSHTNAVNGITGTAYSEASATADRRRSDRHSINASAWVSTEPGTRGANMQVVVGDLSLHGVGFSADQKFEKGAIHWMVLAAGGLRASSRLRVVSCRESVNGNFECGGEFF
jgi:PilZ domain